MFEEDSVDTKPASFRHPRDANRFPHIAGRDPFSSSHRHVPNATAAARIAELEVENLRLQRLVAELLIKNQQLRKPDEPNM
jgi:hypothetical protein